MSISGIDGGIGHISISEIDSKSLQTSGAFYQQGYNAGETGVPSTTAPTVGNAGFSGHHSWLNGWGNGISLVQDVADGSVVLDQTSPDEAVQVYIALSGIRDGQTGSETSLQEDTSAVEQNNEASSR